MAAEEDPADPGTWITKLEDRCRREAMEIRLSAIAQAEDESARALAAANDTVERRITRLRELRDAIAADTEQIERDLVRAAQELMRRVEKTYPANR